MMPKSMIGYPSPQTYRRQMTTRSSDSTHGQEKVKSLDDRQADETSEILAEHSNEGTLALLASAHHFLITRLLYQLIWKDDLTEADYDRLAEEAWHTFVSPNLYSYHTWLIEVADQETQDMMKEVMVGQLIEHVLADWNVWVTETKVDWIENFTL
jgi:hypothetical protein